MDFEAKFCKVTCYIFWLLVIVITIVFIVIGIYTNQSTACQWISAIGTIIGAIFTAVVGFFAYKIAKEQNHSANTSLGMSVSQEYAKIINRAFEEMFEVSDAKCLHDPKHPEKFGMEYPSNVVTPLILASEVLDEIAGNDFILKKKLRILLRKQLNPEITREIEKRESFYRLLERELKSPNKSRILSPDEEEIFIEIEKQYKSVSSLYCLPFDETKGDVSRILRQHNEKF